MDDRKFVRYLLGQMGPDEQAALEEQYLTDPDVHDQLRAAERDLIDQYVRGELPDAAEFERHFLSSPQRRQRVEFARALMQSLAGSPPRADHQSAAAPIGRVGGLTRWAWLAAAAAVILAIGTLLVQSSRNPPPATDVVRTGPPPPSPAPDRREPVPAPAPRPVATLVLLPTLTRNSDEVKSLALAGDVDVALQLMLEADEYGRYRAVVRTAGGAEVWRQDQLQSRRTADGAAVTVTLPSSRLATEDYTIRLSGLTAGGAYEEIAGYYFRVQKK